MNWKIAPSVTCQSTVSSQRVETPLQTIHTSAKIQQKDKTVFGLNCCCLIHQREWLQRGAIEFPFQMKLDLSCDRNCFDRTAVSSDHKMIMTMAMMIKLTGPPYPAITFTSISPHITQSNYRCTSLNWVEQLKTPTVWMLRCILYCTFQLVSMQ